MIFDCPRHVGSRQDHQNEGPFLCPLERLMVLVIDRSYYMTRGPGLHHSGLHIPIHLHDFAWEICLRNIHLNLLVENEFSLQPFSPKGCF